MGPNDNFSRFLSIKQALAWIALSTMLVSGSAYLGLKLVQRSDFRNDRTPITVLVQTGPQREALQTAYISQLLGLSRDRPTFTCQFNQKKAASALCNSPVIKEAKVELLRPGVVYVDYTVRQPIALLADYENTALDADGRAFPLSPFFSPKNLPEIYLGLQGPLDWKVPIQNKAFHLACSLLRVLQSSEIPENFLIRRIDLSHADEKSLGKREIVLVAEDVIAGKEGRWIFPRLIRFSPKDYAQALGNYLKLRMYLMEKERLALPPMRQEQMLLYCPVKVIDLRLSKMAFMNVTETRPL